MTQGLIDGKRVVLVKVDKISTVIDDYYEFRDEEIE
jgi:hypothetical protein